MSAGETRIESDSMGEVAVPAAHYWGAQTQRSLQNFRIGGERMPLPLVHALGLLKQAAAETNMTLGAIDPKIGKPIAAAAAEVAAGKLDDETLYLKADDASRPAFEAAGMDPFTYASRGRRITLSFWQAPADVIEDPQELHRWVGEAVRAAGRARAGTGSRRRKSPV